MIQGTTKDPLGMPKEEHMDQDSLLFLQMKFSLSYEQCSIFSYSSAKKTCKVNIFKMMSEPIIRILMIQVTILQCYRPKYWTGISVNRIE